MAMDLKTRVLLARPLTGGSALKELYPHAAWFQSGVDMGLINGVTQSVAPDDVTKVWFDTTDTTQTPAGSTKRWNGASWVFGETLDGGFDDALVVYVPSPINSSIKFLYKCPYPFVYTAIHGICDSGSCVLQATRNGVGIGGGAFVVPAGVTTLVSSYQFVAGDTVGVNVSSVGSAVNLSITMAIKRFR
jgi:hypothetical protein